MANVEEINLREQRAEGLAAVLAIGTATPANVFYQADFADYYFRVTKSQHLVDLKHKFKRMCDKSTIRKRYMHLTGDMLAANPSIAAYMAPSLDARQDIVVAEVPKLGKEAADKAIKEWGRPKSSITHLVFCTATGVDMPGADLQITRLLRLSPSVSRVMVYQQGCFGGGLALRLSKDLAENNRGARVLVICSEITLIGFRGPCEDDLEDLVGHALFGDGASAAIVGADPDAAVERPLFQLVSARQTIIPGTVDVVRGHLRETGLKVHLSKDLPAILAANMEESVAAALGPLGISNWNSVFWAAHPGGPAIVDAVQSMLGLREERVRATRRVLGEYGNMISASVLFVLDELRKWSAAEGKATTGEGFEWGLLLSFGPGLTVETLVLRACPLPPAALNDNARP